MGIIIRNMPWKCFQCIGAKSIYVSYYYVNDDHQEKLANSHSEQVQKFNQTVNYWLSVFTYFFIASIHSVANAQSYTWQIQINE